MGPSVWRQGGRGRPSLDAGALGAQGGGAEGGTGGGPGGALAWPRAGGGVGEAEALTCFYLQHPGAFLPEAGQPGLWGRILTQPVHQQCDLERTT